MATDLGPADVVVNDVRYVREATLFASMQSLDALRSASQRVLKALEALEAWDSEVGSRSISDALWSARDDLATLLEPPGYEPRPSE